MPKLVTREIDDPKRILLILRQLVANRSRISIKKGLFKSLPARFFKLHKDRFEIVCSPADFKFKPGQRIRLTTFNKVYRHLSFEVDFLEPGSVVNGKVRGLGDSQEKPRAYFFSLPEMIVQEDRRRYTRLKLPADNAVKTLVVLNVTGEGTTRKPYFDGRLVDIAQGGIRVSYEPGPDSESVLNVDGTYSVSFRLDETDFAFDAIKVYCDETDEPSMAGLSFYNPPDAELKKLDGILNAKFKQRIDFLYNRLMNSLARQQRVVNMELLKDFMSEQELEPLSWKRKGDFIFVQVDKLSKGKEAFVIYVPAHDKPGYWKKIKLRSLSTGGGKAKEPREKKTAGPGSPAGKGDVKPVKKGKSPSPKKVGDLSTPEKAEQ